MAEGILQSIESSTSDIWECGQEYKYKIPPEKGNAWENLLEPLLEKDRAQCEAWNNEVQNLLIFAGLFSSVLSAFLVQSYPNLQPDPIDAVVALLSQIALHLDNPLNGTSVPSQGTDLTKSFSPSSSSVRINIFWFISLVLSLTTAIVGIVSLQWLREHQRYPSSLSLKQKFAMFNMRAEALERWYVSQTFSVLPLLLQVSLILFLVGLVDLVLAFGPKLFIPVIVVIGAPLVFIVLTTAIPALQAFTFCLPVAGRASRVPVQCPYKSPQSRAFRRLFIASKPLFRIYTSSINRIYSLATMLGRVNILASKTSKSKKQPSHKDNREQMTLISDSVHKTWSEETWVSFDEHWLLFRDIYAKTIVDGEWWMLFSNKHLSKTIGPLYVLVTGLLSLTRNNPHSTLHFTIYHCVEELTSSIIPGQSTPFNPHSNASVDRSNNHYFQTLLGHVDDLSLSFATFSSIPEETSHAMLREENAFIYLSRCRHPLPTILQHFAELHIRLMNYSYHHVPRALPVDSSIDYPSYPKDQFLHSYGKGNRRPARYPSTIFDGAISDQFSLFIKSFFKFVTDHSINDDTFFNSLPSRGFGDVFRYMVIRQPDSTIQPTLDFVSSALHASFGRSLGRRSDFLFFAASFYSRALLISDPHRFEYTRQFDDVLEVLMFIPVLRQYRAQRGTPDADLRARLDIPNISDPWWDFLNLRPGVRERGAILEINPTGNAEEIV